MKKIVQNNLYMLKYIIRFIPFYAAGYLVAATLNYLSNFLMFSISFKFIADSIANGASMADVISFLLVVASIVILFTVIFELVTGFWKPIAKETLHKKMQSELFQKAAGMDLACYDNPAFYNDFVWATSTADAKAMEVYDNIAEIMVSFICIVFLGGYLISLDVLAFVFIGVAFILQLVIGALRNKAQLERDNAALPEVRRRDYFGRIFYLAEFAKELRMQNMKGLLIQKFSESIEKLVAIHKKQGKRLMLFQILSYFTSMFFVIYVVYYAVMVYKVMVLGTLTLGGFIATAFTMDLICGRLDMTSQQLSVLQENALYIDKFLTFVNYENKIENCGTKEMPGRAAALSVENLDFKYENNEKETLKNICFRIQPNEKIAIVGNNGAGKSTLIKLLMRLYDPTSGRIMLDNEEITKYPLDSYRSYFSAVFQDFQIFATEVGVNISMESEYDPHKAAEALFKGGFTNYADVLVDGLKTNLTREFDSNGAMLSGGELQKIAIARVLYSDAHIIILDEPSSALDPITEYNFNKAMKKVTENKSVVFISHRMSTTRMADCIYMLENGSVIEQGSHEELMRQNGKYANMYQVQARKYRMDF